MLRPALELADVFHRHGSAYRRRQTLPVSHLRVMRAVEACRTAALSLSRRIGTDTPSEPREICTAP